MLTTILIPLDGSSLAERALAYGEMLARSSGARLVLLQVVDATRSASDAAETYLGGLIKTLDGREVSVETTVAFGEPAGGIVAVARACQADLIVLTSHGRSDLGRWAYGGVVQEVLARSTVPVLLVRSWDDGALHRQLQARPRLLVPLDGSDFAEEALPVASTLASALGADVTLLRVVQPPEHALSTHTGRVVAYVDYQRTLPYEPGEEERLRNHAQAQLDEQVTEAEHYLSGLTGRFTLGTREIRTQVRVGSPSDMITAVASEQQVALVIMATHGRTGLGRLLSGSVARAVLRQSSAPLLLVRPAAFRRMLSAIASHADAEQQSLAAYRHLAETIGDPMVVLLLRLVLEDEERHYRLLEGIEASLRADLRWERSSEALPTGPVRTTADHRETVDMLRNFMEEERQGARHMRELRTAGVPIA